MPDETEIITPPETPPPAEPEIVFTPAQQARMQQHIDAALATEKAETARLLSELLALQGKDESNAETIKNKDREIAETKEAAQKLKKSNAISTAAMLHNFVNAGQVALLTRDSVKEQDGEWVGVLEDGTTTMPLSAFYKRFADSNPHMVKGEVKAGVSSTPSRTYMPPTPPDSPERLRELFGKGSNAVLANALYMANPAEYKTLKIAARRIGLIG